MASRLYGGPPFLLAILVCSGVMAGDFIGGRASSIATRLSLYFYICCCYAAWRCIRADTPGAGKRLARLAARAWTSVLLEMVEKSK
ncbi:MAG: hypothetical protein UDC04_09590, partial [Collinsella bouchesdurhonensis]|nr:hypothetical protein [Collinsella bouchesdurhonensis]